MSTESTATSGNTAKLVAAMDAMMRRFARNEKRRPPGPMPLTHQEFRLILAIGESGKCTMGELAETMLLSLSSVTSLVDKLVNKSFAQRQRPDDDRRIVYATLTKSGSRLYNQCLEHRMQMAKSMLGPLSEKEQKLYIRLVTKIGAAADTDSQKHASKTRL